MRMQNTIIRPACGLLYFCLLLSWSTVGFAAVRVIGEVIPDAPPKIMLVVYAEGNETAYFPTGFMGNTNAIICETNSTVYPHSGNFCIKTQYRAKDGWGGLWWLDPAYDFGDQPGGHDLNDATQLTFWARGETGGELINFFFGSTAFEKPYFDTADGKITVTLTRKWKQYFIDLTGKDLSRIKRGFGWSAAAKDKPFAFYLDDIQYEEYYALSQ
jgi:hypothetical protein